MHSLKRADADRILPIRFALVDALALVLLTPDALVDALVTPVLATLMRSLKRLHALLCLWTHWHLLKRFVMVDVLADSDALVEALCDAEVLRTRCAR